MRLQPIQTAGLEAMVVSSTSTTAKHTFANTVYYLIRQASCIIIAIQGQVNLKFYYYIMQSVARPLDITTNPSKV
jgi:hypothetical protein